MRFDPEAGQVFDTKLTRAVITLVKENHLVASAEFAALYGANLSDADFVDQLYLNVLGREGEAAGVGFWNGYLADGGDRAAALVDFTQLPEYVGLSQADIVNGYWVMPS